MDWPGEPAMVNDGVGPGSVAPVTGPAVPDPCYGLAPAIVASGPKPAAVRVLPGALSIFRPTDVPVPDAGFGGRGCGRAPREAGGPRCAMSGPDLELAFGPAPTRGVDYGRTGGRYDVGTDNQPTHHDGTGSWFTLHRYFPVQSMS